ncbi:unnamed protein product [Brugia timori]|uniref:Uncharacterized protein n=1 Tax=Brugia timori TaxID=42155 RepID=A0A0R3R8G1_9BILA|nr:unnamed protein product [Brugia timori]
MRFIDVGYACCYCCFIVRCKYESYATICRYHRVDLMCLLPVIFSN